MQKTNFNYFRAILLDPTPDGVKTREDILAGVTLVKTGAVAVMGLSALACVFGTGLLIGSPWYAARLISVGIISGFLSRDIYVISENTEEIMGKISMENLLKKASVLTSSQLFVHEHLKDTYVIEPSLSDLYIRVLSKPQGRVI